MRLPVSSGGGLAGSIGRYRDHDRHSRNGVIDGLPAVSAGALSLSARRPTQRLKVLVVDDDECARETLKFIVEDLGHVCAAAGDGLEAWELHQRERFDVVLSDWLMPRMNGVELCRKMRVEGGEAYTYFILVTALIDREHLVQGLQEGADEYLVKPIDLDELNARLQSAARVAAMNRTLLDQAVSLRRDSERAQKIAAIDPLTGIHNRLGLEKDLASAMARATRYQHRYSVGLCDVDFFKRYNDTFGHLAGDDVLRGVAEAMRGALRAGDGLYRYGGEEFLVLLPEQTLEAGRTAMDRLRREVERLGIGHDKNEPAKVVTVSAGVAEFDPAIDHTAEDWLRRADRALYFAKQRGRNIVAADVGGASGERWTVMG